MKEKYLFQVEYDGEMLSSEKFAEMIKDCMKQKNCDAIDINYQKFARDDNPALTETLARIYAIIDLCHKNPTTGKVRINNVSEFIFKDLTLVDLYTTINVDFSNPIHEFGLLMENNVINYLIQYIPSWKIYLFDTLLENAKKDFLENNWNTYALLRDAKDDLKDIITPLMEYVDEQIKEAQEKAAGESEEETSKDASEDTSEDPYKETEEQ